MALFCSDPASVSLQRGGYGEPVHASHFTTNCCLARSDWDPTVSPLNSDFKPALVKVSVAVAGSRENLNFNMKWFSAKQTTNEPERTPPFFWAFAFSMFSPNNTKPILTSYESLRTISNRKTNQNFFWYPVEPQAAIRRSAGII